ncbi:Glutamate transport system permease protein GluD [Frankia canadensis]|uniref:Glutamate transport system permease protein GluD n=1 Tax=Frankia canadensis TaxID=1836972 RepID=A0A2I2KTR1_9ACTN|nr:amino acid ABC transporter permease [Frankia canadensis]SNQ49064.1 Glutamate transport system permease protein GluD [Frankia canadensis]SOU56354.1 Glutamate transport system permease protein GluD [Frankia canadensis]
MSSTPIVLADPPGPRGRRRILIASFVAILALAGLVTLAALRLAHRGQFDSELWSVFVDHPDLRTLLWHGLLATLRAALTAMAFAVAVGIALAVGRMSARRVVRIPATGLVELFRSVPVLMLMLFAYLGLPALGWKLSAFWAVVLGLTAYNGAVLSEIFRAGIGSIDRGQSEAAAALGLRPGQTFRLVLFPQAVRRMSPALVSQLVTLLKDTSLGFVIAYSELLRSGRGAVEFLGSRYAVPVYTAVAVLYIATNGALSFLAHWLEGRQNRRLGNGRAAPGAAEATAAETGTAPTPP